MTALVVIQTVVIVLLGVLVAGLLRSHAEILRALHDLGVTLDPEDSGPRTAPGVPRPRTMSTRAADIMGASPTGGDRQIGVVDVEHATLLAFLSSGCLTCAGFWDAFQDADALQLPGHNTRLVVVTKGADAESPSQIRHLASPTVPTVMSSAAWVDFAVPVSPYFILVDGPSGAVVGEGAASSWDQVSSLLSQAAVDAGMAGSRPIHLRGTEREERTDTALRRAGVEPGDPSLFPERHDH